MELRRSWVLNATTAVLITLAVGWLAGGGWPMFVMGAVLALALAVMVFFGSYAAAGSWEGLHLPPASYAAAAVAGVALGWVVERVAGGASWWAVGFILAGSVVPATMLAARAGTRSDVVGE